MKMYVCAVFDNKAETYGPPQFFRAVGEASRAFVDACSNAQAQMVKYPEDFTFNYLATFDTATGRFENVVPETLLTAVQAASFARDAEKRARDSLNPLVGEDLEKKNLS